MFNIFEKVLQKKFEEKSWLLLKFVEETSLTF